MVLCLAALVVLPFFFADRGDDPGNAGQIVHHEGHSKGQPEGPDGEKSGEHSKGHPQGTGTGGAGSTGGTPSHGLLSSDESRKGAHGHDLDPSAPNWYLTVHGDGPLADVFALDAKGQVIGGILGPLPAGEPPLSQLRGLFLTGDNRLAVVNAYMKESRLLLFGEPNAQDVRPLAGVVVRGGPGNPGFVHPYQVIVGPDGTLYAANQDSNTITRYSGLGSAQPGRPLPIPEALAGLGTLPPGTIVPNAQHSPEGLHQVRGIAWGPDGLLYAADRGASMVAAFDPATGRRVRTLLSARQGLGHPIQLLVTPDRRHLLVSDNLHHCVWRVDLGTLKTERLVPSGSGGLHSPSALAIQGDHLLVGSRLGRSILKYRLKDGRYEGVFATLQANPEFLIPVQQK